MKTKLLIAVAFAMLCSPAWAINKCTGSDGKVAYQDAPCTGKGAVMELRTSSVSAPKKEVLSNGPSIAMVPVPSAVPELAIQAQSPMKSPLLQEADECLGWYKSKLRDPSGAYYSEPSKDSRVLTITVHATNGYGGYTTKSASCEFNNGVLDNNWTKIHAKRGNWSG